MWFSPTSCLVATCEGFHSARRFEVGILASQDWISRPRYSAQLA